MNAPAGDYGDLEPQHADYLRVRGVSPEVAALRGYRSILKVKDLRAVDPAFSQRCPMPVLLIPRHTVSGKQRGYSARPDNPRTVQGQLRKYEVPDGQANIVDCPPGMRELLDDPAVDLYVTESPVNADSAASHGLLCIGLNGVYGFRGKNAKGGIKTLRDFDDMALNGRRAIAAYDSDVMTKREVHEALDRMADMLGRKDAVVRYLHLPMQEDGSKTGLDGYLVANGTDGIEQLIKDVPPGEARPKDTRPVIDCDYGEGPVTIRALQAALNRGTVPGTYVTAGKVVLVEAVSGAPDVLPNGDRPLPVVAREADPASLSSQLAEYTRTFKVVPGREGPRDVEFTPAAAHLNAALAKRQWPGLRPLHGIIGAPVMRPHGCGILQDDGYDPKTGLFMASRVDLPRIPARPSAEDVRQARELVFGKVLADFPWVGPADKANYVAKLVTQIIRRRLGTALVPLFATTATGQSGGKTLMETIPGALFGQVKLVWTGNDEELRKALTTVMLGQEGVITFDNVPVGGTVRSAVLANLLTGKTWGDRLLGGNALGKFANDRLWTINGNNLSFGGDIRTRTVLISIDPKVARPEQRTGFAIPDLESWIEQPASQEALLYALLVLVADWGAAGCPRRP